MKSLAKLLKSTGFRMAVVFTLVFALCATAVVGYIYWNTNQLLTQQVENQVEAEASSLSEQYEAGGIVRLINVIEQRSVAPGNTIYLLLDINSRPLAGNLLRVPTVIKGPERWIEFNFERFDSGDQKVQVARARTFHLPNGFTLVVGRDIADQRRFEKVITTALLWGLGFTVMVGLIAGLLVSRRMLGRIDRMTATSRRIMAGKLDERLHETGSGDELDRLAQSLNQMLERIEELLRGMREVSDNVAHDLKTPITRMRNRVEEALRGKATVKGYRGALEQTIEESDHLIRVFNALLSIARVEAGASDANFEDINAAELLKDISDLYEPVAEEAGAELTVEGGSDFTFTADRGLISQALANLIENAIKYGVLDKTINGRQIRLAAELVDREVHLRVSDNGPGIPEADKGRVLERFSRIESSRSEPGSGLGLSLVAAVAKYHGGRVDLSGAGAGDLDTDSQPGLTVSLVLEHKAA